MEGLILGGNVFVTDNPTGFETDLDLVTASDPILAAAQVDPDLADFRPLAGSPVIDRAIDSGPLLAVDADGTVRPPIEADVGAYEFTGS